jgi:hypothetical protein
MMPFLMVVMLVSLHVLPQWRANHYYVEGRCELLDKRLIEERGGAKGGVTYRAEFLIRYTVDGREYQARTYDAPSLRRSSTAFRWPKERVLATFTVGEEYPCWYDPQDPSQAVLVRDYDWFSYAILVALVVVVCITIVGVFRKRLGLTETRTAAAESAADSGTRAESGTRSAGSGHSSSRGDLLRQFVLLVVFFGLVAGLFWIINRVSHAERLDGLLVALIIAAYFIIGAKLWGAANRLVGNVGRQPPDGPRR